ncbi:MAG: YbaK/EbsC family protein [Hyphomicrobiales bacterium]|nr:YbaK/EbsC family protein [Hyphomicrobiales bacterium]
MSTLPESVQKVARAAEALGLAIHVREMVESTRTAEEAAAACGCDLGQIVKSLVFRGKTSGRPYLLLVSGRNRVDEAAVARHLGEKLKRPDAAYVREVSGFAIGGIPPFGHSDEIVTYVDEDLLGYEVVWAAAGTPRAVFAVDPKALAAAIGATAIDVGA